jgi:hypothetical protein
VLALLACLLPASTKAGQPEAETVDIAADAYTYGYPLVLVELTRAHGLAQWGVPVNTFHHVRELKGPENTANVHTNNDNLYSSAFVDLTAEPIVLHVPETTGRYFLLQMLDAWTNTFAAIGFIPGEEFNPPEAIQDAVNAALPVAYQRIGAQAKALGKTINGWDVILTELGTFGTQAGICLGEG